MKNVLTVLTALLLVSGAAFAQDKSGSKSSAATTKSSCSKKSGESCCGTAHGAQPKQDSAQGKKSCCMQPSRTAGLRAAKKAQ
ncbi:hypothetical protein [Chitinophaga sp. HK235]|uniref:hypothetical protein n=1 Tax=Chitinophaga sp. HK235 TaxID=2952571 RepID=UPI001BA598E4|nr:hypothetical protein [Chitinophaga sp. HK235]